MSFNIHAAFLFQHKPICCLLFSIAPLSAVVFQGNRSIKSLNKLCLNPNSTNCHIWGSSPPGLAEGLLQQQTLKKNFGHFSNLNAYKIFQGQLIPSSFLTFRFFLQNLMNSVLGFSISFIHLPRLPCICCYHSCHGFGLIKEKIIICTKYSAPRPMSICLRKESNRKPKEGAFVCLLPWKL